MKITKREHACLDIADDATRLIVDPGSFTAPFDDYSGISTLVITHVHGDHFDIEKVHKIAEQNPSLEIYTTQQVADKLDDELRVIVPNTGVDYESAGFTMRFYGGLHAVLLEDMPQDENFGVLINNILYYPGDSFTPCDESHSVTAVPSIAPWSKVSETIKFMKQDSAATMFPTHNAIASDAGNAMLAQMLGNTAKAANVRYDDLKPGQTIEV